ncbi:hypothetical protein DT603_07515 [Pseudoxanthomonas gei]|uniref:Uncharacterized protein n=1 Tax=Pseudoxanthomonas gei TaxID=1383030 RepID=A0ABX0AAV4_9GAMM|nr:hypothetical protein [Pseudoxanthomonas gei]NDK38687.1 hypothetical protein [Pseudoxanthomonas gei]
MRRLFIALVLAIATLPAHAALFGKSPEKSAAEAAAANMSAATIWIDASWGFRNQGAANSLSKAHNAFAARGYKVVSVEPYIENGDLQGFFVTYQKP